MFALRVHLLPRLYHKLILGATRVSELKKVDVLVRQHIRRVLRIPHDTPNAYFHATVGDGGLGVPALRYTVPQLRLNRLSHLEQDFYGADGDAFLISEMDACKARLRPGGEALSSKTEVDRYWKVRLARSYDGEGLGRASEVKQAHSWVGDGTGFMSGGDYIECIRTRINAIPTRYRCARGQPQKEVLCRAGCRVVESAAHVIQGCHRTHGKRIKRHDVLVHYTARSLKQKGFEVHNEPRLRTTLGLRKPDLIAIKDRKALVVDAQVISDRYDLSKAHEEKCAKYSSEFVVDEIKKRYAVTDVITTSVTLNWRGVWSGRSADSLLKLNVLAKADLRTVSARALMGSVYCWHFFKKTTLFCL